MAVLYLCFNCFLKSVIEWINLSSFDNEFHSLHDLMKKLCWKCFVRHLGIVKLLGHELRRLLSGASFTKLWMLILYFPFRQPWMKSKSLISCQYVRGKRFVCKSRSLYGMVRLGIPRIKLVALLWTLSTAIVMVIDWPDHASLA